MTTTKSAAERSHLTARRVTLVEHKMLESQNQRFVAVLAIVSVDLGRTHRLEGRRGRLEGTRASRRDGDLKGWDI